MEALDLSNATGMSSDEDDEEYKALCRQQERMLVDSARSTGVEAGEPWYAAATRTTPGSQCLPSASVPRLGVRPHALLSNAAPPSPLGRYLMPKAWLDHWEGFVESGGTAPKEIDMASLLDDNGQPLPGLAANRDYLGVNEATWEVYLDVYKANAPAIKRKSCDVYSAPC